MCMHVINGSDPCTNLHIVKYKRKYIRLLYHIFRFIEYCFLEVLWFLIKLLEVISLPGRLCVPYTDQPDRPPGL